MSKGQHTTPVFRKRSSLVMELIDCEQKKAVANTEERISNVVRAPKVFGLLLLACAPLAQPSRNAITKRHHETP